MNKKIALFAFGLFFVLAAPAYGKSLNQRENKTANSIKNQQKIQSQNIVKTATDSSQNQNQNKIQNCEIVQSKIAERINRFERKRERHLYTYDQLTERLNALIKEWKADGYNVSAIEKDLATWQEKTNQFSTQSQEMVKALYNVRYLACEDGNQFKGELKQARIKLKNLMTQVTQTRSFYRDEIRQDILDLKEQKLTI